jgi:hypothetical protein
VFLRKHLRHPCAKPESGGAKHKRTRVRGILVFAICSFVPALAFVSKSCAQVIEPPQARVSTAAELQNAVTAAASSKLRCIRPYVIWVENDAAIDMDGFIATNSPNNFLLSIPSCVTLASGRTATVEGGLLFQNSTSAFQQFMLSLGAGARVTGLRLRGPSSSSKSMPVANGAIVIDGVSSATVDNNEIFNWPLSPP